jgi:3-hydroxybutyryl-CoA dehydrogenase
MMKLCEVVRGYRTSERTMDVTAEFVRGLGKTVVVVTRDVAGFVANRMLLALTVEAVSLLETGVASAEDIDTACRDGFGHKMGPLQTADLAGLDVTLAAIGNIYADTQDPKFVPPGLLQRMVAAGEYGRKTGRGFYPY